MLALLPKKERQSLHGYVREHLRHLEQGLLVGGPYRTLAGAVRAAGFRKIVVRSMRTAVYRARKKRPGRSTDIAARPPARSFPKSPSFEMQPQLSEAQDGRPTFGRRFRELAMPPTPGTDEPDPLV